MGSVVNVKGMGADLTGPGGGFSTNGSGTKIKGGNKWKEF